ncbi:Pyruvate dehydrogenase E1, beta subunit, partial [Pseudoloma neurophilia]
LQRMSKKSTKDKNPVVFLESEVLYKVEFERDNTFDDPEYIQEFKAVVERDGTDLTLIGIGTTVGNCLEAANTLEKENISSEVINLISIRPIDYKTILKSVRKTKNVIIVENSWPCFSTSSEISANLNEKLFGELKRPVQRITAVDVPTPYAHNLETMTVPNTDQIVKAALEMYSKK